MATVRQVLAQKSNHVHSITPRSSVLDAALLMNEYKIGALVVMEHGEVVGIITERDVLRRVVAHRGDPAQMLVEQVMTRDVICCHPDTPVDEARGIFMTQRIRHMPVVDDRGRLVAMVSIGDLNAWQIVGQEQEIFYLHEYLYGRA